MFFLLFNMLWGLLLPLIVVVAFIGFRLWSRHVRRRFNREQQNSGASAPHARRDSPDVIESEFVDEDDGGPQP